MRGSALAFAMSFAVLVIGGGLEELLPKVLGVGFPFLLASVQFAAARPGPASAATVFAIAAGGIEDALSGLPPMTSVSFFLAVAAFTQWSGLTRTAAAFTYPAYQLWLAVWTSGLGGSMFARLLLSLPIGLATGFVASAALAWAGGKGAIDERG